jgi:hypothetical protein
LIEATRTVTFEFFTEPEDEFDEFDEHADSPNKQREATTAASAR